MELELWHQYLSIVWPLQVICLLCASECIGRPSNRVAVGIKWRSDATGPAQHPAYFKCDQQESYSWWQLAYKLGTAGERYKMGDMFFPKKFFFFFFWSDANRKGERERKKIESVVFWHRLAIEKGPKATSSFWIGSLAPSPHLITFNIIPGTAQRDGRVDLRKFT